MTKVTQLVVTIFWSFICLFAFTEEAKSCSCPIPSIEKRFATSDFVFTAKVIGTSHRSNSETTIEEKGKNRVSYLGMVGIIIEFEALRDYKGSSSELEYLITPSTGAACGVKVEVGSFQTFFVQEGKFVGWCDLLQTEEAIDFYEYLRKEGLE